jgi:hypothetical protein
MSVQKQEGRLVVNKALRRRAGFFGYNSGLGIATVSILVLGFVSAGFLPLGMVIGITSSLFLTTIYIFRDGTDQLMGKFRSPRHYTRGGLEYTPLFKNNAQKKRKIDK